MLLGAEKMDRWLVAYSPYVRVRRAGRRAMLVCPEYGCDYWEAVDVVRRKADTVIFNPLSAGYAYLSRQNLYGRTLEELSAEISRLKELYRQSRSPKLPSAARAWRERFEFQYSSILRAVHASYEEGRKISLERRAGKVDGWVKEVLKHAVILERADTGELENIRLWDLVSAYTVMDWKEPKRAFNFGQGIAWPEGVQTYYRATRFLVIGGQTLAFNSVDRYGLCRVHTDDPEVARAFRLIESDRGFVGEIPGALAEKWFKVLTFVHVQGFRLYVEDFTNHPDWVIVRTRNMEAARQLLLRRESFIRIGPRQQLDWVGPIHRAQVERWEEVQVQIRRRQKRSR